MNYFSGAFSVVFAALLWSVDGVLRQSLYAVSPLVIVALEHLLGTILFSPLLILKRKELLSFTTQTWISVTWISLFGGILGTYFYTKALGHVGYIDLSVVVLLQKLQPFFAISLAAIMLRERITLRFLLLAGLAFIGGYLITFAGVYPKFSLEGGNAIAALLAVGAAFCWGTSTVFGKKALESGSFFLITALRLLLTFLLAIIPLSFMGIGWSVMHTTLTGSQWTALSLIVVSTGAVALCIYYFGLKRIPASHATLYELTWPLSAMVIDYIVNDRMLSPIQYLGAALLLGAMLLLPRTRN